MSQAIFIHLHGKVQGVGLRHEARIYAKEHGLKGWVRNRSDGRVTCCLDSHEDQAERFVEHLKALFKIENVEKEWRSSEDKFDDFEIKD